MNTENKLLWELVDLIEKYSSVYRGSYLPSRTSQLVTEPGSKILRESDAEHVGLLPVTAAFIYPHLENKVDLGKVLTMLAIHDIGETVVGDVLTVKQPKTENQRTDEQKAALSVLDPYYHDLFIEFEEQETLESKCAHSVDKMTAHFYEFIIDKKVAQDRHAFFGFDIVKGVEKDKPRMEWDGFVKRFYDEICLEIRKRFT